MLTLLRRPLREADATSTFYALTAVAAFAFAACFTLNLVFQYRVVGLDPFQMVLVGTVLEATCFLFEVPTGIVADLWSRRVSVIIGFVLIGAGFAFEGVVATFAAAIVGNVVWGIGYTFTSGALQAWITDEVGEDARRAGLHARDPDRPRLHHRRHARRRSARASSPSGCRSSSRA